MYSPIPFSLVQGGKIPYPLRSWRESPLPTEILDIVDNLGYEVCQGLLLLLFCFDFFFCKLRQTMTGCSALTNAKGNENLLATVNLNLVLLLFLAYTRKSSFSYLPVTYGCSLSCLEQFYLYLQTCLSYQNSISISFITSIIL